MPSRKNGAGSLNEAIATRAGEFKKKPAPPAPPPTLSHFVKERVPIRLECERCWRKTDLSAEACLERFGDVAMPEIEHRLVCSACGEREMVDARPLYERRGPRLR